MDHQRLLVVCFPGQGHINPTLKFSKQLLRAGVDVTFATIAAAYRRMREDSIPEGLTLATYSDGYEDAFKIKNIDYDEYMDKLRIHSSLSLGETINAEKNSGKPFTCVVYTTTLPWVATVAREHHVPSLLLWLQPATVFRIYQFCFDGDGTYGDVIRNSVKVPSYSVLELPGLPTMNTGDLPSFLLPSSLHASSWVSILEEHIKVLKEDANPKVLVNTFGALEARPLGGDPELIAVGPLVPSALSTADVDGDIPSGQSQECVEWLGSKPEASVVYVSFGSYSVLPKCQVEEIARALLDSGRPFLWVLRKPETMEPQEEGEGMVSCIEELESLGKIVTWCPQVEVLSSPAVGCFVTHCGWNSTLESLVSGVPLVACPLWSDQPTNARLVEGSWRTGVRVQKNDEGTVKAGELRRCMEMVMGGGEAAVEMRRKAAEWKALAREAASDGGSSHKNLKAFVEGLAKKRFCTSFFTG